MRLIADGSPTDPLSDQVSFAIRPVLQGGQITIGAQMVAAATTDRFFAPWTGTVPTGAGLWFSSLNPPAPPVGAMFGQARTYYLTSGDQFRPPPPPAFGSDEYNAL